MRPTVSVIITSFNALERLRYALESYKYQTYPKDRFEVIVVDDGSIDGTKEWCSRKSWNFKVRYVHNEVNKGRAGARNAGLHTATGEIIIMCDSDMIVTPDFIRKHAEHHLNKKRLVVCGSFWNPVYSHIYRDAGHDFNNEVKKIVRGDPVLRRRYTLARKKLKSRKYARLISDKDIPKIAQSKLASSSSPITHYFTPYTRAIDNKKNKYSFAWICFVVMNVSVRRKYLERIGFFDENFVGYGGEDTDVGYRLWKEGLRFIVDTKLKNYHQEHPRIMKIQESERGRNKIYLAKKHQTAEMLMQLFVSIGNDQDKSRFLLDRDRLLAEGVISARFVQQLDWLIWTIANAEAPYFQDELKQLKPIEQIFFRKEMDNIKELPQFHPFVDYVSRLFKYAEKIIPGGTPQ